MVLVAAGERFRPVFPLAGTEYMPVWFPEFQSDRYIREEEEEEEEDSEEEEEEEEKEEEEE